MTLLEDAAWSRWLPLAGIVAPLVAVAGARVLLSAGPAEAPAADLEPAASLVVAPVPASAPALTDDQRAVLEHLRTSGPIGPDASPMRRPAPAAKPTSAPQPAAGPDTSPSDVLTLNAVVGSGTRALASIDNRIYRLGDEPLAGWRIESIEASARRVVLRNGSSGEEAVLSYNRPDPTP